LAANRLKQSLLSPFPACVQLLVFSLTKLSPFLLSLLWELEAAAKMSHLLRVIRHRRPPKRLLPALPDPPPSFQLQSTLFPLFRSLPVKMRKVMLKMPNKMAKSQKRMRT
jgi:hypothetical protein